MIIAIIVLILLIAIIVLEFIRAFILIIFQVNNYLGITDHLWQEKSAAIAATVNNLGDRFRPAL